MNIVKSARGVDVDFDLLRMKEQMQMKPKDGAASTREKAVGARKRRGSGKILQKLVEEYESSKSQKDVEPEIVTLDVTPSKGKKKINPQIALDGGTE